MQIRSVFEEAWSEIDHRLRFSQNRIGKASSSDGHFGALKVFVDGCIQYAEILYSERIKAAPKAGASIDDQTFDKVDSVLEKFTSLPSDISGRLEKAYRTMEAAKKEIGIREFELFTDSASQFESIYMDHKHLIGNEEAGDIYLELCYWCRMEQAYCLMHSSAEKPEEQEEYLEKAAELYRQIEAEYENDVVCYFRHAQVLRRLGNLPESIEKSREALALLDAPENRTGTKEKNWLSVFVRCNIGFALHKLFEKSLAMQNRGRGPILFENRGPVDILGYAIQIVEEALTYAHQAEEISLCLNNLVYFYWDLSKIDPARFSQHSAHFNDLVTQLRNLVDDGYVGKPHTNYDTLTRAYLFLGDFKEAEQMARGSLSLLDDTISKRADINPENPFVIADLAQQTLSDDEYDAYMFAQT